MFDFFHPIPGTWGDIAPYYLAALFAGYLLGSIPFGLLFGRLAGGDVRKIGSGNIGATNVLRTGKKWAAAATFLCDAGKGAVAVIVLRIAYGNDMAVCAGFGAVLGHIFPLWLKFRGGKGVSTFFGVMIALYWPVGLLSGATWIVVALLFRISSLSALVATAVTWAYMAAFGEHLYATMALALAVIIWLMHRGNIARLVTGKEPRIGRKPSTQN